MIEAFLCQNAVRDPRLRGRLVADQDGDLVAREAAFQPADGYQESSGASDAPSRDCAGAMAQVKVPLRPVGATRP